MKKTKFLVLTLAVCVMLMGAGYAWWTDTLTINTTVEAGELKVVFSPEGDTGTEPEAKPFMTTTQVTVDDQNPTQMTIDYDDVYPGAYGTIYFTLVNEGTLDAYVNEFEFTKATGYGVSDAAFADFIREFEIVRLIANGNGEAWSHDFADGTTLNQAFNAIDNIDDGKGIYVPFEGQVNIQVQFQIDPSANDTTFVENTNYGFTVTADVDQYNEFSYQYPPHDSDE